MAVKAATRERWNATRREVLQRDGFRCVACRSDVPASCDIHHLLPRSMGGSDELSNLVSLCDGCHAAHHPNLAGGLARSAIERWAMRLARWLEPQARQIGSEANLGSALRLFGVPRFRTGQLPIILAVLSGKSVLVVSPTGSGKTLCFQLPAILRERMTVVVSPLKTLMGEQVADLLRKKIPATFLNSDLSIEEKKIRFSLIARNATKFLYLAPERFFVRNEQERELLAKSRPEFLVVDEAHCVDQWGRDFRPEYGRLAEIRRKMGAPPVLAFTATAGRDMQQRILASLGVQDATVFVRGVDRPNITLFRLQVLPERRALEIATILGLDEVRLRRAMIFVPSARVGDDLRKALLALGADVPFYHSKLGNAWERQELVKRFRGESRPAINHIICTNAFGMGLDIPDVRLVIHWQQPASVEDFLQEFGRAGRDGNPAAAVIFHEGRELGKDAGRLRFMAEKTVEAAGLMPREATAMLEQRFVQIGDVSKMLMARSCFRKTIVQYFEGPVLETKASLGMRILEWIFGTRQKQRRFSSCCDFCDAAEIEKIGHHAKLAAVVSSL